jgi:hypothetical protein
MLITTTPSLGGFPVHHGLDLVPEEMIGVCHGHRGGADVAGEPASPAPARFMEPPV